MASTKNITMRQFNGIDYDTLYPKTKAQQILGTIPVTSGGTGATTAGGAVDSLITALSTITPAAGDLIALKDANGTAGKTTLTALATLMSSLGGGAKIQTGSYVGTGTYGSSNPCSLTFDFEPKLFVFFATENAIYYYGQNTSSSTVTHIIMLWGTTTAWVSGSGGYRNYITYTSNKISWYNDSSAARQCNESGTTYKYCALG